MDDLRNRFTYHPPKDNTVAGPQADRYVQIRGAGLDFADLINVLTPDSREKSLAITKIEEAIMWANAAIARNE